MHEKRQHRRIPFARPVSVITQGNEKVSLMCTDFSMQGIGFTTTVPRDIGEILRVTMNIGTNGRTHVLNALGEVVHRCYKDKKFQIGMRFYSDK